MKDNPFPATGFDDWAGTYDNSVTNDRFPFFGYQDVLKRTLALADSHPGLSVLDLGTGTGNLALLFTHLGCKLWCTDFSHPMLARAYNKIPSAHLIHHDLRDPLPFNYKFRFDRIVSAYVFHHFKLEEKVRILLDLVPHLVSGGRIIIGDIAFPNSIALQNIKVVVGEDWEDEFYWLVDESMAALRNAGLQVKYIQVSSCAGVFSLQP